MTTKGIISLLTDFGVTDGYVGTVKAVILSRAPHAGLVDLSHDIPAQDITRAAFLLYTAAPYFPPGSVHLAVVDPGVGSSRKPIAVASERAFFVGPDNGLFTYALARDPLRMAVELREAAYRLADVSNTFHGRDIFAPAAAHLAAGGRLSDLGPPAEDLVQLPPLMMEHAGGMVRGTVLYADRFGNLTTSIGPLTWQGVELALAGPGEPLRFVAANATLKIATERLHGVHHTFANAEPGALLALVGSHGHIEVARRNGDAARRLSVRPGDPVILHLNRVES
jgi:S-adenosylmethionine hydrolase